MMLDELTQPGWQDAAYYFREQDTKYGISELRFPAVIQWETDDVASAPPLTTFRDLLECLDIVPRISRMPQGTSQPRSSHIRQASVKLDSNISIHCPQPA